MTTLDSLNLLDPALCMRVALTLLHFLWQGAATTLLAALVVVLLRRASASVRYGVWLAALVVMAACPVATYLWIDSGTVVVTAAAIETGVGRVTILQAVPTADAAPGLQPPSAADAPAATEAAAAPPAAVSSLAPGLAPAGRLSLVQRLRDGWPDYAHVIVLAYFGGVILVLCRLTIGLIGCGCLLRQSQSVTDAAILHALGRQAQAAGLRSIPAIFWCRRVLVPTVEGQAQSRRPAAPDGVADRRPRRGPLLEQFGQARW